MNSPLPIDFDLENLDPVWHFLKKGNEYIVVREFTDHDGSVHKPGEEWKFLGSNFVPYHDGLSLFVEKKDKKNYQIRMCAIKEAEGPILDQFENFVVEKRNLEPVASVQRR